MPKHPSTQADNIKLRFSVFIVKVTRQGMDEPKTISLIVELSINAKIVEHKSKKVHVHTVCFYRFIWLGNLCIHVSHWFKPRFLASFCHL